MLSPLFALWLQAARFGLELQSVMALRLMRWMGGGASARSEARRSGEKMAVLPDAQTTATTVSITNGNDSKVGKTVSRVYKKRGHANKRRLSKRPHPPKKRRRAQSGHPTKTTGRPAVWAS
jgi:hypothetical protein